MDVLHDMVPGILFRVPGLIIDSRELMRRVPEVFLTVLNMSITASFVFIAILVLRLLLKRAPKRIMYLLWLVLLFRLVCPVSLPSTVSLFNLFGSRIAENGTLEYISLQDHASSREHASLQMNELSRENDSVRESVSSRTNDSSGENAASIDTSMAASHKNTDANNTKFSVNSMANQADETAGEYSIRIPAFLSVATIATDISIIRVAARVWISGIVVMLAYSILSYLRLKRKLTAATLVSHDIYETDEISSPFVCGFIKPRIYLPTGIGEREREYVVLHERAHISRRDHIVKPIAFLTLSIHWFSPLIWMAFRLMSRDMELNCDELVSSGLDQEGRARYGETLMSMAIRRPLPAGSPLAFGESVTKSRIINALNYRKPAFWIVCAAAVVVIAGMALLLTNPVQTFELPDEASVIAVEMEQFDDLLSIGRVTISDAEQIGTILSAMNGAKKTPGYSVSDHPGKADYLEIKLILRGQTRKLYLYSEGRSDYIEEPYVGIYRIDRDSSKTLYQVYTANPDSVGNGNTSGIRWDISTAFVQQPVKDYAADYVHGQIERYNALGYNIIDAKVTAMTRMNTGTASLNKSVGMLLLEYRLLPEDPDKAALADGMRMEDGWLTEWNDMGQPLLVLVCDWNMENEYWRRVGITGTLEVREKYRDDHTAATMEMYHDFISKNGIVWAYVPARSSVFPAMPIRFELPFSNAHVTVDRGQLLVNDRSGNYSNDGKEADCPASGYILWSPSEIGESGDYPAVNGCMLHFEITAEDGGAHKGTIIIEQLESTDGGVWYYSVSLVRSDTGLILAESDEPGGCILMLP